MVRNGLLVQNTVDSIADTIIFLLDHPNLQIDAGKNNIQDIMSFSWAMASQKYLYLYKSLKSGYKRCLTKKNVEVICLGSVKVHVRSLSEYFLRHQTRALDEKDLAKSAVIFAPHPDDETLGCGGTMLKKISADAEITLCFLTNGENSHSDLISKDVFKKSAR
jgi:hypothetical protein